MSRYLLRRLLISIPVLAGISLILFSVLALAPGDPFEELATNPNVPAEVAQRLREQFGLDDPVLVRYARWFTSMLRGDWGFSFVSRVDVDTLILQRLGTTLWVLGSAQLLGILVALPIGVLSALRPYSLFDQVATTFAFIGFALPALRLDYVNTARSKGLSERVTIVKHVVRNALIPVVTLVALQIPGIFTGAIVTEQIFRVPGIGSLLISSILANDTPVVMAITFVFSCLVVVFNLVVDLLYGWLDPRPPPPRGPTH